jgi:hypothetical protein
MSACAKEKMPNWRDRSGPCNNETTKMPNWRDRSGPSNEEVNWRDRSAPSNELSEGPNWRDRSGGPSNEADEFDWRDRSGPTKVGRATKKQAEDDTPNPPEPLIKRTKKHEANLDLTSIELTGNGPESKAAVDPSKVKSKDAQNGMDRSRIHSLLAGGCCGCRGKCANKFKVAQVLAVCVAFWCLPHEGQNFLLHTMYKTKDQAVLLLFMDDMLWKDRSEDNVSCAEDAPLWTSNDFPAAVASRMQWKFDGSEVCMEGFYRLLGIGKHRLLNAVAGSIDLRVAAVKAPTTHEKTQFGMCWRFLAELYVSSGEPAPNEFRSAKDVVSGGDPIDDDGPLLPGEVDVSCLKQQLGDLLPTFLSTGSLTFQSHDTNLPIRYLEHTHIHHLYWLFIATVGVWSAAKNPPSWSVFYRAWCNPWRNLLRFRKSSTHSQCNVCWECHQLLKKHLMLAEKYQIAVTLRDHLRRQYMDRAIYWCLREASLLKVMTVLCIIIDSMDKTKFALPRFPFGRIPKMLDGFVRPVLTLTGVLAHGFAVLMLLCDETVEHGQNAFLEVLLITIDKVYQICRARNLKFPENLVIQSDNPTNQAKNSAAVIFLAYLVCVQKFTTATLNFLTVGHTHEDIDQVFAFICALLLQAASFQCPDDVVDIFRQGLADRAASKGEELVCEKLDFVRDFAAWQEPLGVKLEGAFGNRNKLANSNTTTVHSFILKHRAFLLPGERAQLAKGESRDFSSLNKDVFLLMKVYMHSTSLSQPPLLTLPLFYANRIAAEAGGPSTILERHEIEKDRRADLEKRAELLSNPANHVYDFYMPRAAQYYKFLLNGPGPSDAATAPSPFLLHHVCANSNYEASTSEEFPHLPDTAWRMKIKHTR